MNIIIVNQIVVWYFSYCICRSIIHSLRPRLRLTNFWGSHLYFSGSLNLYYKNKLLGVVDFIVWMMNKQRERAGRKNYTVRFKLKAEELAEAIINRSAGIELRINKKVVLTGKI